MNNPIRPWGMEGTARQQLIDTINATGGLNKHGYPKAAPDWHDLGLAYHQACKEEGVPVFQEYDDE